MCDSKSTEPKSDTCFFARARRQLSLLPLVSKRPGCQVTDGDSTQLSSHDYDYEGLGVLLVLLGGSCLLINNDLIIVGDPLLLILDVGFALTALFSGVSWRSAAVVRNSRAV